MPIFNGMFDNASVRIGSAIGIEEDPSLVQIIYRHPIARTSNVDIDEFNYDFEYAQVEQAHFQTYSDPEILSIPQIILDNKNINIISKILIKIKLFYSTHVWVLGDKIWKRIVKTMKKWQEQ